MKICYECVIRFSGKGNCPLCEAKEEIRELKNRNEKLDMALGVRIRKNP